MEVDCDGASAAKRRRERRPKQSLRQERLSVAMVLAAAQHHSAPKSAGPVTYDALRGQNTTKAGRRPGVLKDPEPQGGAITVGYVAASGPLLEVSSMAGGDSVDGTDLPFLVKKALERQKEEEEERRKAKEERKLEVTALLAVPMALRTPAQQRRIMELSDDVDAERRTPRSFSRSPRGRARRRQRQCFFLTGYAGYDAFHAVFLRARQSCLASWTVWTRMTVFLLLVVGSGCGICSAGFTGIAPRVVFLPVFVRPLMLGIMAGMNQRDSYVSRWSSTSLSWRRSSFSWS